MKARKELPLYQGQEGGLQTVRHILDAWWKHGSGIWGGTREKPRTPLRGLVNHETNYHKNLPHGFHIEDCQYMPQHTKQGGLKLDDHRVIGNHCVWSLMFFQSVSAEIQELGRGEMEGGERNGMREEVFHESRRKSQHLKKKKRLAFPTSAPSRSSSAEHSPFSLQV